MEEIMEKQLLKRLALSALVVTSAVQATGNDKNEENKKPGFFSGVYNTGAAGLGFVNRYIPETVKDSASVGMAIISEKATNPRFICPVVAVGTAATGAKLGFWSMNPVTNLSNGLSAASNGVSNYLNKPSAAQLETAIQAAKKVVGAAKVAETTAKANLDTLNSELVSQNNNPFSILWGTTEIESKVATASKELVKAQNVTATSTNQLQELEKQLTARKAPYFVAKHAQNIWDATKQTTSTTYSWLKNSVTTNGSAAAQAVVEYVKANPKKSIAAATVLTVGTGAYLGYKYLYSSKDVKSIDFTETLKIAKAIKEEQKQNLSKFRTALDEKYEIAKDDFRGVYFGRKEANTLTSPFNSIKVADYTDDAELQKLMQGYINNLDAAFENMKKALIANKNANRLSFAHTCIDEIAKVKVMALPAASSTAK